MQQAVAFTVSAPMSMSKRAQKTMSNPSSTRKFIPPGEIREGSTALFESDGEKYDEDGYREKNFFEALFDPYPTKIPAELQKEIYDAEENTQAAKDRKVRQLLYSVVGFGFFLTGFANVFLTEMRGNDDGTIGYDLLADFANSNGLVHFVFATKLGGYLCIGIGVVCAFLLEAEVSVKRSFGSILSKGAI